MRNLALVVALFSLTFSPSGPRIDVPRGATPVIDGKIDKAEWARAESDRLSDGSVIRLQHDGRHLFIAIEAVGSGFASLCVAGEKDVRVLHASAALGSVTYTKSGADWTSADKEFGYGMRNPALTDPARAERLAYLTQHGWVASTVPMTQGRTQELQISLDVTGRAPLVALGFFLMGSGEPAAVATWPRSMPATDGCAAPRLVSGYVPSPLSFQTATWATLRIQ